MAEIAQGKDEFNVMADANRDGILSEEEIRMTMLSSGLNPTEAGVQIIINAMDADGDGFVGLSEYLSRSEKQQLYRMFDMDSNGLIALTEIIIFLANMGLETGPDYIESFEAADNDNDGQWNYDDFATYLGVGPKVETKNLDNSGLCPPLSNAKTWCKQVFM